MTKISLRILYYGLPLLFIAYPVLGFLWMSFLRNEAGAIVGPITLANYARIATEPTYLPLLFRSVILSLGVSAFCVFSSFLIALWISSLRRTARYFAVLVFVAPLLMSYIIKIYAIRALLGNQGYLNRILTNLGVVEAPIDFFTFNMNAVFLTFVLLLLPFAFLPIFLSMEKIETNVINAGRDLGATESQLLRLIVIPMVRPSMVMAASLVFVLAMGDFITPEMVGGPSGFTFGRVIYSQFGLAFNWPFGAALAAVLMLVVIIALALGAVFGRERVAS